MKKFFRVLQKNFKVLFRAKTSLLAVILGPLLVIGLIGFAFNSSGNIDLTVGYYAPDQSQLTIEIVTALQQTTNLQEFPSPDFCITQLELGLLHTCIIFPQNFVVANGQTNNLTYIVDKSRVNLVYTVIEQVSKTVGIKSDELSRDLTEELLTTLSTTTTSIDSNLVSLIKLKKSVESASSDADSISSDLGTIDLEYTDIDIDISSDVATLAGHTQSLKESVIAASRDIQVAVDSIRSDVGSNSSIEPELSSIESEIEDINETAVDELNESDVLESAMLTSINDAVEDLEAIEKKLETAQELTDNSRQRIATLRQSMAAITSEVAAIQANLEGTVNDINSIEVTSSEQIVNPINTNIQTVSSDTNQLTILFPYVIMLVIMFVGLMLSSTLVMVEKKSRASFRVFTTPTRDEFFIFTTFVTAFIIVALQVGLILLATKLFLVDIITRNIGVNVLLLVLAMSIFIMIGMAVGYLLNNQQSANMTSISLGALFLFFSNIMLPLESLPLAVQKVAAYNPFVLASETLRKSILFAVEIEQIYLQLGVLLGYTIVVIILIIVFQRMAKVKFFARNPHVKESKKMDKQQLLWIGDKKIEDEKELITYIQALSEEEYRKLIAQQHKQIKTFLRHKLGRQRWMRNIRKLTRAEFIIEFAKENKKLIDELRVKRSESIRSALTDSKKGHDHEHHRKEK